MTEGETQHHRQFLKEYDIKSIKDLLDDTLQEMMETEMDSLLGYSKSEHSDSEG